MWDYRRTQRYPSWSAGDGGGKHRVRQGGQMDHARRAVFRHGMPRVRNWAVWSLPRPLLALWSVVTCGYAAWIAVRAASFQFQVSDLVLFAALLGCGAFSVELTRRA